MTTGEENRIGALPARQFNGKYTASPANAAYLLHGANSQRYSAVLAND